MLWWVWILLGFLLLLAELLTPGGLYLLFFGVAAIIVGLLAGLNLIGPPWMQWLHVLHFFGRGVELVPPPTAEALASRNAGATRLIAWSVKPQLLWKTWRPTRLEKPSCADRPGARETWVETP